MIEDKLRLHQLVKPQEMLSLQFFSRSEIRAQALKIKLNST